MTLNLSLDELVTSVATDLMGVTASSLATASQQLLHRLVDYFDVDLSFLRRHDLVLRATILVAEWPPRLDIPVPDPLGTILFAESDPIFAATEHLSAAMVTRPGQPNDEYQKRVQQGSGVDGVSSAGVPLLSGSVTVGILGFVKFGDRDWRDAELNALRAVAALLAQLQARIAAEEGLRYLADHDELTGLANRRALVDHLSRRLQNGSPGPVAVIFMDVDRLKTLNSFLGHAAGDQFLQTWARRLEHGVASGGLLARLGGDEFVLVTDGPAAEGPALLIAEGLRSIANQPVHIGGEEVCRAVSLGVAIGWPGVTTVSGLLGEADQAMMQAKDRGGNEISVFTAQMREQNRIRTDIEMRLRSAIRDGSLILHYQPEVDLVTGSILGVEALVRWQHPTLGLLQPKAFIDVAEATNLSGELGRWVIHTGCRQLKRWHADFPHLLLGLSVNVSPAQLITVDFVATVEEILRDCGLDGHHLTLEITENALVRDFEQALTTLLGLRALAVQVAIDDFGTGYSSFAQLKNLPVNTLKIDRTFVRDLGTNANDLAIVGGIINLAQSFGLQLIAEGVETELAAATLTELGCFRAQGFLFAGPGPVADIEVALRRGKMDRPQYLKVPGTKGWRALFRRRWTQMSGRETERGRESLAQHALDPRIQDLLPRQRTGAASSATIVDPRG